MRICINGHKVSVKEKEKSRNGKSLCSSLGFLLSPLSLPSLPFGAMLLISGIRPERRKGKVYTRSNSVEFICPTAAEIGGGSDRSQSRCPTLWPRVEYEYC